MRAVVVTLVAVAAIATHIAIWHTVVLSTGHTKYMLVCLLFHHTRQHGPAPHILVPAADPHTLVKMQGALCRDVLILQYFCRRVQQAYVIPRLVVNRCCHGGT